MKAKEICGGRAFFRGHDVEGLLRDVQAAPYHPRAAWRQQLFAGRRALGRSPA